MRKTPYCSRFLIKIRGANDAEFRTFVELTIRMECLESHSRLIRKPFTGLRKALIQGHFFLLNYFQGNYESQSFERTTIKTWHILMIGILRKKIYSARKNSVFGLFFTPLQLAVTLQKVYKLRKLC